MILEKIVVGVYGVNSYILGDEDTKECVIVDPGSEPEKIIKKIEELNLKPKYIILTHGHVDHISATLDIKEKYDIDIMIHREDEYLIKDKNLNLSIHAPGYPSVEFSSDILLEDGKKIKVGNLDLKVIHTPGHTKGGICLLCEDILLSGDTLFMYSYGRYDLEGGNFEKLKKSILNRLFKLDPKIIVYPGHGARTTIAAELKNNPIN